MNDCCDPSLAFLVPDRRLSFPAQPVPIKVGRISDFASYVGPTLIVPLPVQRGDSLQLIFRAFRDTSGCEPDISGTSPQVLTGYAGSASVRRAKDHPISYPLTVSVDQTGPGSPTRGQILISATPEQTRLMPDHGVWDLDIFLGVPPTIRKTVAEGPLYLNRDTTY